MRVFKWEATICIVERRLRKDTKSDLALKISELCQYDVCSFVEVKFKFSDCFWPYLDLIHNRKTLS